MNSNGATPLPGNLLAGDECLFDTNVLIRWSEKTDPQYTVVRDAVKRLRGGGVEPRFTAQNGIESWRVLTRPIPNGGFGYTVEQARRALRLYRRAFLILPETPAIYDEWLLLVSQFGVSGVQVHDARLVAVMRVYGVSHILTLNGADFARYATLGIVAINPNNV